MKFAAAVLLVICMLSGCNVEDRQLDRAMDLRKTILSANECTFQATVTADYGDVIYTFQMECIVDDIGNLQFTVTDPVSISGITGTITQSGAALTFDDKVLAFPMLADDELAPVSAPWIFINTLRSGYITGSSREEESICIYIDDSFEDDPLHLEIYTNDEMTPVRTEIIWQERRTLSMDIRNFSYQ